MVTKSDVKGKNGRGKQGPAGFTAHIRIALKKGVSDPEGNNTLKALRLLGFASIDHVSTERVIQLRLNSKDAAAARAEAERACRRLLTNPVIHDFHIDVEAAA